MYRLRLLLMVVLSLGLVGAAAMMALGGSTRSRADEEVRATLRRLADSDPEVRLEAAGKLRAMGDGALPLLREACASPDKVLARRSQKLLDEMEGRSNPVAVEPVAPSPPAPQDAPARPAVEIELIVPKPVIASGEPVHFYARLRNNTSQPVLIARHRLQVLPLYHEFATFEVAPVGGEAFVIPADLAPQGMKAVVDAVAVGPGETIDLYHPHAMRLVTSLHTRLLKRGEYVLRYVYEVGDVYSEALFGVHVAGVPLTPGRIVSNAVTVTVE